MVRHVEGPEPVQWQPSEVPRGWQVAERRWDGIAAVHRASGLRAIMSANRTDDDRVWLHLSVSTLGRLPTWPELVSVKEAWLGEDVEAYQVCPPRSRYVNLNGRVLHLWSCLDEPDGVLPDFTGQLPDGRRSI